MAKVACVMLFFDCVFMLFILRHTPPNVLAIFTVTVVFRHRSYLPVPCQLLWQALVAVFASRVFVALSLSLSHSQSLFSLK